MVKVLSQIGFEVFLFVVSPFIVRFFQYVGQRRRQPFHISCGLICKNPGSPTGEHGIGFEKIGAMNWLFDDVALDLMRRVRETFDPTGLCNPGKVVPTPGRCSDVRKTFGAKRYA